MRRDNGAKSPLALDAVAANALALLGEIQVDMFNGAKTRLIDATHDVANDRRGDRSRRDGIRAPRLVEGGRVRAKRR